MERLCKKCILPETYAGIRFNEQGICNFCEDYKSPQYLGEDRLKEDVFKKIKNRKNNKYDCVVGFSGGRDSTYLLWYIVNILKLKPLAVFVDSKLIPEQTIVNLKKTVKLLNVDLVIKQHDLLLNSITHFLKSWSNYPSPATLITLCTGCRLGVSKYINNVAVSQNVPIVFAGGTPFEEGIFKRSLISTNMNNPIFFIHGYAKQVIKNPSLISNLKCLRTQINEYITASSGYLTKNNKNNFEIISPFVNYFRWEEEKIEKTIKSELEWKRYDGLESSYRGDCEIGIIRQYLYNKMLGYNDKDDQLSWLIRDGQISREKALKRIMKEKATGVDILNSSFSKLGIDFYEFISHVEKNARKHNIKYSAFVR